VNPSSSSAVIDTAKELRPFNEKRAANFNGK